MSKQVVVTGIGIVSPIGRGEEIFWKNCCEGKSGISSVKDPFFLENTKLVGGQVLNYKISNYYSDYSLEQLGRASQFLFDCIRQSIKSSGINIKDIDQIHIGTTMGESTNVETIDNFFKNKEISEELKRKNNQEILIEDAIHKLGIKNVSKSLICNACSGGNYAIVNGYEVIRNGVSNTVAVGGIDPYSSISLLGFNRLGALAKEVCKPFSKNRDGMLVSEGGCVLILEEKKLAINRGARILAEIVGYGLTSDAYHINAPHPEGKGIESAIKKALDKSKISADHIDYISLHGTGTIKNDQIESKVINKIFGGDVYCSSIKSMIGHTMGAASAIEAAVCCLALRDGVLPPTINFDQADEECQINCLPNKKVLQPISYALNLSAGFGGTNAALILKKY